MAITWRAALDLNPDAMLWQSKRSEVLAAILPMPILRIITRVIMTFIRS